MTIHDADPPTHELSSEEDRARLLQEALAHAEAAEALYKQPMTDAEPTGPWKAPLSFVVLLLAAYLAVLPPGWLAGRRPAVSLQEAERGVRAAIELQASEIEAFRTRTGRLPDRLDELEVSIDGLRYVRSGNRAFQIVAAGPRGNAVLYDSSRPTDDFRTLEAVWSLDSGSR